jgi:hypothetical protein
MDTSSVFAAVESALTDQLALAGHNEAVVVAGETLLATLGPALRKAAIDLAEQAALEVRAQLPDHEVAVVVQDGEPSLDIRGSDSEVTFTSDDLAARLTLRLPERLKSELEEAAGSSGDSINAYVVKALAGRRASRRSNKRITGTFET